MLYVVYKVLDEIDCESCLSFLIKKLDKHNLKYEVFCEKCQNITIKLENEEYIEKVSHIISDSGYENKFQYIGTKEHHHQG